MISYARVGGQPRTSAGYGSRMPRRVRPACDESISFTAPNPHSDELGAELAARIVAEHRTATACADCVSTYHAGSTDISNLLIIRSADIEGKG